MNSTNTRYLILRTDHSKVLIQVDFDTGDLEIKEKTFNVLFCGYKPESKFAYRFLMNKYVDTESERQQILELFLSEPDGAIEATFLPYYHPGFDIKGFFTDLESAKLVYEVDC